MGLIFLCFALCCEARWQLHKEYTSIKYWCSHVIALCLHSKCCVCNSCKYAWAICNLTSGWHSVILLGCLEIPQPKVQSGWPKPWHCSIVSSECVDAPPVSTAACGYIHRCLKPWVSRCGQPGVHKSGQSRGEVSAPLKAPLRLLLPPLPLHSTDTRSFQKGACTDLLKCTYCTEEDRHLLCRPPS